MNDRNIPNFDELNRDLENRANSKLSSSRRDQIVKQILDRFRSSPSSTGEVSNSGNLDQKTVNLKNDESSVVETLLLLGEKEINHWIAAEATNASLNPQESVKSDPLGDLFSSLLDQINKLSKEEEKQLNEFSRGFLEQPKPEEIRGIKNLAQQIIGILFNPNTEKGGSDNKNGIFKFLDRIKDDLANGKETLERNKENFEKAAKKEARKIGDILKKAGQGESDLAKEIESFIEKPMEMAEFIAIKIAAAHEIINEKQFGSDKSKNISADTPDFFNQIIDNLGINEAGETKFSSKELGFALGIMGELRKQEQANQLPANSKSPSTSPSPILGSQKLSSSKQQQII